jgi:two-component system, OmpR family, copper resistance phosphate regulon response regulator CusR
MRVLVIEDQKKMISFLKRGLKEQGYSVDTAESASAGEILAFENSYDLILLDVMLPDKNGIDVARTIRSDGYTGPLLMLTALSRTKDKIRGLDAGADDYITKPFAFEELLARIRALLRRNNATSSSNLTYKEIELDLVRRKVWRGKKEIELSQKEFSLLEYFLRKPERPVSRTELSEHVWDMNFDPKSNVIDAYMSMLRKKIDGPYEKKLIHTIIGIGYVLEEK